MNLTLILVVISLIFASAISYFLKKLTIFAALTALLIGITIYFGSGFIGLLLIILFFVVGNIATKWKLAKKQINKHYENQHNGRNTQQVVANGGLPAILSLFAILYPHHISVIQIMLAGSLSAALADTLSSELGIIYGSKHYDILSLKKVSSGPDGIISLEGLLFGLVGSFLIALAFCLMFGNFNFLVIIVLSGTIGNLIDSVLGATFERKGIIGNNLVNFINTLTGTLICFFWVNY